MKFILFFMIAITVVFSLIVGALCVDIRAEYDGIGFVEELKRILKGR